MGSKRAGGAVGVHSGGDETAGCCEATPCWDEEPYCCFCSGCVAEWDITASVTRRASASASCL